MKKYKVILADPAWKFKYYSKEKQGYNAQHYPTMTTQEICDLKVNKITDDDCVLFLWATFPLLDKAFEVIKAWGFEYKTVAFTWIKKNKNGNIFKSMGYWTMANAEICLLATKGKPKRIAKDVSQIIISQRREHSRKPDEIYNRIEKLMGNVARIELFSRNLKVGWDAWGNEVPNYTQVLPSAKSLNSDLTGKSSDFPQILPLAELR